MSNPKPLLVLILFFSGLFLPSTSRAEGIYEIKYSLNYYNQDIQFTALIFFYSNQSASNIMRIKYSNNSGGFIVMEQKFHCEQFISNGTNYWVFKGDDNYDLDDHSKKINTEDLYISKSLNETYYKPAFVKSKKKSWQ